MKKIKTIITSILLFSIMLIPVASFAQASTSSPSVTHEGMLKRLEKVGTHSGYNEEITTSEIIGKIIGVLLGFLGTIFIILIITSGYNWMTAAGNEEKIAKAQKIIKEAIIGLIITLSVWTLWTFIFEKIIAQGPNVS